MRTNTRFYRVAGRVAILLVAVAGPALGSTPVGSQFQVNTQTTNLQWRTDIAVDGDGDFVVVWEGGGILTGNAAIRGQRYDSSGSPVGGEFLVSSGLSYIPSSAADAKGDFVVVWQSYAGPANASIQGQRFDAAGNVTGSEFQVNTYTTGYQTNSVVDVGVNGHFVVVWESTGSAGSDVSGSSIQGQRFGTAGSPVGGEFQVNSYTTNQQIHPAVGVGPAGDFLVVWASLGSPGNDTIGFSIHGQRYDSNGMAIGSQFQVNTYTSAYYQVSPRVSVESDGDFVVVWSSDGGAGSDNSGYSAQGQRYDSTGSAVGAEFQVNTYTTGRQVGPRVDTAVNGDFVVVWTGYGGGSDTSDFAVLGQRFDSLGNRVGAEFQVNTYTTSSQIHPAVGVESNGDFVVAWASDGSFETDSSQHSIQGQRFVPEPTTQALGAIAVLAISALARLKQARILRR